MRIRSCVVSMVLALQLPLALAAEPGDILVGALEADKLLNLGVALLAAALCILTLLAYRKSRNVRLQYVSAAFFLFALKGVVLAAELLFGDWPWADILAGVMDVAILLTFFIGILKK